VDTHTLHFHIHDSVAELYLGGFSMDLRKRVTFGHFGFSCCFSSWRRMETVFSSFLFDELAGFVCSPFQQPDCPDSLKERRNPKSLRERKSESEAEAPKTESCIFEVLLPEAEHILDGDVSDILSDHFVFENISGVLGLHHHHDHAGVCRDFHELYQSADQKAQVLLVDDFLQRLLDSCEYHGHLFEPALFERQGLRQDSQNSCSSLDHQPP